MNPPKLPLSWVGTLSTRQGTSVESISCLGLAEAETVMKRSYLILKDPNYIRHTFALQARWVKFKCN